MAKAKASFEGLIPSTSYTGYLANYDGAAKAGGFSFKDMYIITEHAITAFAYTSTGYQTDMHGTIDAFFSAYRNTPSGYGKGYILSPSTETFNLKTGDFASAWDSSQTVTFTGYKANGSHHSITVTLTNSAVTVINFANYGNHFSHIVELKEFTNTATSGSFGKGWQVVVDNLKVKWNGAVPGSHGQGHVSHGVIAAMHHHDNASHSHSGSPGSSGFHSELTSLVHDHGSLTSQFNLPQSEHFGV